MNALNVWKLALLKLFLLSLVSGATTYITSMSGVEWPSLSGTQKCIVYAGIFISIANSVIGFLDRTVARISENKTPFGDTQIFQKQQ